MIMWEWWFWQSWYKNRHNQESANNVDGNYQNIWHKQINKDKFIFIMKS